MVMARSDISYFSHFQGYRDKGVGRCMECCRPQVSRNGAQDGHLFNKKRNTVRYLPLASELVGCLVNKHV